MFDGLDVHKEEPSSAVDTTPEALGALKFMAEATGRALQEALKTPANIGFLLAVVGGAAAASVAEEVAGKIPGAVGEKVKGVFARIQTALVDPLR